MLAFVQVRAVVICFDTTFRVRGVDMKSVEMGTYGFDGAKALTRHGELGMETSQE